mgnify:CR=1 FL=1
MSHMKWIYCMVSDNSYNLFKSITETAIKTKAESFEWNGESIETAYAICVCEFVDKKAMPDYEKHLQETIRK